MPVDKVAYQQTLLDQANKKGTLNNEANFRNELEKFQSRFKEQKPSVIDISTDAQRQFREDMEVISALGALTMDREVRRLCMALTRVLSYLERQMKEGD
jgi:hypothetical protein